MNITTDTLEEVWHDMKAPGAYEWWYFDAEDRESGLSFVIIWFAGFPFSPYYADRYEKWKKHPATPPPLPADYSGFSFQLYENGRESINFIREGPNGLFESSRSGVGVRFEKNVFSLDRSSGEYRVDIDFSFPARRKEVKASLRFKPSGKLTFEKKDSSPDRSSPLHQWLLGVPRAEVEGTIEIIEIPGRDGRSIALKAVGYHDHNFGSVPLHEYVSRWYWGRAFSGYADLVYYLVFFRDPSILPLTLLYLHDKKEGTARVINSLSFRESNFRRGLFSPLHGRHLELAVDSVMVNIRHERVLDAGPFYLRFSSGISLTSKRVEHEPFVGISEYLDPSRLQSRFMRFFTSSRIWRDGERSLMYDIYNKFKHSLDLKKR
jgi:carotenoid 1,2-hydratase